MTPVDDDASISALIRDFLGAVSFRSGSRPDYIALYGLFAEGARLVRTSGDRPESSIVDEFVCTRTQQIDSGRLTMFDERETAHVTECFGNVAHRFSTYSKRGMLDGVAIEADGMISTQFVRTPSGWRIAAMAWDDERPGLTIPDRYRAEHRQR